MSSIPEQLRNVARLKNFPDMGKIFFPLQTYDISEHVMIKLHMNYHNIVPRWVRPQQKPGWQALFWEVLVMSCDKRTIQQILR